MSEWKKVKLDDCLELITYGFTNPMPDTLSGPWKVTAKDINNGRIVFETARHTSQEAFDNDLTDKSRPKKGDILLTKDGTLGRLAIVGDERVCINQSVALLRVNKDILSVPYLYYLLSTPLYQAKMIADAGGAAIKHIYITRVNQLLIPCPSYDEQCRIANILSRYDSLIENYQKQIKLLEEAAQRLYKEWFVDLHFPGHENAKIVDGVPEGWEKKTVGDIAKIKSGYAFKSKDWQSTGCPVVKIKDITGTFVNSELLDCVSFDIASKAKQYLLNSGDLVIAMTGATIGKIGIIVENGLYTNQRVGKFFLNESDLPFVYCLFKQESSLKYIIQISSASSAQPNISGKQLESLSFVYDKELYKKYNIECIPFFKQMISLQSQIRLLTEARDRLLPKLMSGEIAV